MTDLPAAAITAAATALKRWAPLLRWTADTWRGGATAALEAAAPHITAAERQRIYRLAIAKNAQVSTFHPISDRGDGRYTYSPFADLLLEDTP